MRTRLTTATIAFVVVVAAALGGAALVAGAGSVPAAHRTVPPVVRADPASAAGPAALVAPAAAAPAAPVASAAAPVAPAAAPVAPAPARELPVPEPVPADPYADVPVTAIGRIEIPAIGVDEVLYEGVWLTVIDQGPGHWPGTAAPGAWGNVVVGAHRTVATHPFEDIDLLGVGDTIVFHTGTGTFVYRVTNTFVVDEFALWIVDQEPGFTATLFACHPKGSSAYRYVVQATLVEA